MIPSENVMPIMFVAITIACGPLALATYLASIEVSWRRWRRENLEEQS